MRRSRRALAAALLCTVVTGAAASAATPSAAARKRVVVGSDGYLFSSQDWTVPCQDAATSDATAQLLVDLGDALQQGGRRPVLLLGPDKSTIMTADLPRSGIPDSACHAAVHDRFWATATSSRYFLDLRAPLKKAAGQGQVYYRKDTHFSHGGDTVYTISLLRRLDPLLALGQGRVTLTGTVRGDLATVLGLPAGETVSAPTVVNPGVVVRELPQRKVGLIVPVRSFTATPTAVTSRVLPGRTVFVGDSFTAVDMYQLSQLSAETVFVWTDNTAPLQPMLDEIAQGDRVVVEVVERFATRYRMFRQDVVDGVRALPPRSSTLPVAPVP